MHILQTKNQAAAYKSADTKKCEYLSNFSIFELIIRILFFVNKIILNFEIEFIFVNHFFKSNLHFGSI